MTKTRARAAPRKGFWVAVLPFEYTVAWRWPKG
jgi:hypothetical protein